MKRNIALVALSLALAGGAFRIHQLDQQVKVLTAEREQNYKAAKEWRDNAQFWRRLSDESEEATSKFLQAMKARREFEDRMRAHGW